MTSSSVESSPLNSILPLTTQPVVERKTPRARLNLDAAFEAVENNLDHFENPDFGTLKKNKNEHTPDDSQPEFEKTRFSWIQEDSSEKKVSSSPIKTTSSKNTTCPPIKRSLFSEFEAVKTSSYAGYEDGILSSSPRTTTASENKRTKPIKRSLFGEFEDVKTINNADYESEILQTAQKTTFVNNLVKPTKRSLFGEIEEAKTISDTDYENFALSQPDQNQYDSYLSEEIPFELQGNAAKSLVQLSEARQPKSTFRLLEEPMKPRKIPSEYERICLAAQFGTFTMGQTEIKLTFLSDEGSFFDAYDRVGYPTQVVKVFNQRRSRQSPATVDGYLDCYLENFEKARLAGIPVGIIYNINEAREQKVIIQERIAGKFSLTNQSHRGQLRYIFLTTLKSGLIMDLHPLNMGVKGGYVAVYDFVEEPKSLEGFGNENVQMIFIIDALEKWCAKARDEGWTREDTNAFLDDLTEGFDNYGYPLEHNKTIIDQLYKTENYWDIK